MQRIGKYETWSFSTEQGAEWKNERWALSQTHKSWGTCQNKLSLQFCYLLAFVCNSFVKGNSTKSAKSSKKMWYIFYENSLMIYARVWICRFFSHKSNLNCLHSFTILDTALSTWSKVSLSSTLARLFVCQCSGEWRDVEWTRRSLIHLMENWNQTQSLIYVARYFVPPETLVFTMFLIK